MTGGLTPGDTQREALKLDTSRSSGTALGDFITASFQPMAPRGRCPAIACDAPPGRNGAARIARSRTSVAPNSRQWSRIVRFNSRHPPFGWIRSQPELVRSCRDPRDSRTGNRLGPRAFRYRSRISPQGPVTGNSCGAGRCQLASVPMLARLRNMPAGPGTPSATATGRSCASAGRSRSPCDCTTPLASGLHRLLHTLGPYARSVGPSARSEGWHCPEHACRGVIRDEAR